MSFWFWLLFVLGLGLTAVGTGCGAWAFWSSFQNVTGRHLFKLPPWPWRRRSRTMQVSGLASAASGTLTAQVRVNAWITGTLDEKVDHIIRKVEQFDSEIGALQLAHRDLDGRIAAESKQRVDSDGQLRTELEQHVNRISTDTLRLQFLGLVLVGLGALSVAVSSLLATL